MPDIRLENISKYFDETVAADNLNLEIYDGEYLCILGPTGAGKTTCMRIICGLTRPDEGSVYFDGEDVTKLPVENRQATMLTQVYSLFPHMNVRDNIEFSPRMKGWGEEECAQLSRNILNMVHLEGRSEAYPNQLSGGQQQRIALARALVSGSKVLLLDEPLRALDARLRLELRKELKSLAKSMKMTSIHVTHDQDEALEMADRIAIIRDGHIVQIGTPKEVFDNPATPFVANFVGRSNMLEGTVIDSNEEYCIIKTTNGQLIRARNSGFGADSHVLVAIKIGNTKIAHLPIEGDTKPSVEGETWYFRGTIERILYEGASITIETNVPGVGLLSSKLPNRKYDDYFAGETVNIVWAPIKASVFPYPENGLESELRLD